MGVLSQGMLCSPRELGLSDDHAGIYILPPGHAARRARWASCSASAVIDLDIKAHRGDLFCVHRRGARGRGLHRQAAASAGDHSSRRRGRPPAS